MNEKQRRLCERLGFDPGELVEIDIALDEAAVVLLCVLNRKVDKLMTDISALQAAVDNLAAAEGAAVAELTELKDEVAQLTAGTISQEQIDSITGKVTAVADALTAATQEAGATPGEPPAPEPEGEPPAGEPPAPEGEPTGEPPAGEPGAEPPA